MNTLMKKLVVGILAVLLLSSSVHAATITVETWSGDPSTNGQVDWSAGSAAFTHARNFAANTVVDVDFVPTDGYGLTGPFTFYGVTGSSFSGAGGDGSITVTGGSTSGGADTIDGADGAITRGFRADDFSTLTLTGLTANTDYELVLYQANFQANRIFTLTFNNIGAGSSGNDTVSGVNRGNTKVSIAYTTGTNTEVSLDIDSDQGANHSWNWYAFSNETIIPVPEPSTSVLAALGLLSLGFLGWRQRRRA